jgi:hypothetical protein
VHSIFWTGVLGTFARKYAALKIDDLGGTMMQNTLGVDAVNMVLWFVTFVDLVVKGSDYHNNIRALFNSQDDVESVENSRGSPRQQSLLPRSVHSSRRPSFVTQVVRESVQAEPLMIPSPVYSPPSGRVVSDPIPHISRGRGGARTRPMSDTPPPVNVREYQYYRWPADTTEPDPFRKRSPANRRQSYPTQRHKYRQRVRHDHSSAENLKTPASEAPSLPTSTKECIICTEDLNSKLDFPSLQTTLACNHEQSVCRRCLERCIQEEINSNFTGQIHCPECRAVLEHNDVQSSADHTTFAR